MTSDKREKAIKYLTEEIRSLRMAPQINGCGPENWADQLEIMDTCLKAVRAVHFAEAGKMQPITEEQLREMDRQPVKVKNLEDEEGGINIGVVTMFDPNDSDNGVNVGCAFFCIKEYGETWLAYAYPPHNIDRKAWVNVEDRLPEDEKPVLAYYGFYREDDDLGARFIGTLTYFSHDPDPHWQHESTGLFVTHWMHLPEPPAELEKRLRG